MNGCPLSSPDLEWIGPVAQLSSADIRSDSSQELNCRRADGLRMAIDSERDWADGDEEPVGGEGFAHLSGQSWSECHDSAQLVTERGALGAPMRALGERYELVRKGSR